MELGRIAEEAKAYKALPARRLARRRLITDREPCSCTACDQSLYVCGSCSRSSRANPSLRPHWRLSRVEIVDHDLRAVGDESVAHAVRDQVALSAFSRLLRVFSHLLDAIDRVWEGHAL